jgi:NAD+ diphosphatase
VSDLQPGAAGAGPTLSRSGVDRVALRRDDEEWLAQAFSRGRVLILDEEGKVGVLDEGDGPRLMLAEPDAVDRADAWLLGVDETGTPLWAAVGRPAAALGARLQGLRQVGARLSARDSGLLVTAVALANWHATHPRCPRCGTVTDVVQAGWQRRCPEDGSSHFPRTDPAVIVLVHDGADRCLLGRQPAWPAGRYSTLAGFVESGESAEAAVRREVAEESGVIVADVVYRSSQPWPFPASLMLGYEARAVGGEVATVDHELEDVRWFTRAELRAGAVLSPPSVSIAHWLITTWLDGG